MDKLTTLNETDRLNLADIAWFLRGLNYGKEKFDQPFDEHHFITLEKTINAIRNHELESQNKPTS